MTNPRNFVPVALVLLTALILPSVAGADFVCPSQDAEFANGLDGDQVVGLVLSTLLQKGVAVVLLVSTSLVSLPWLVAGAVTAVFHLPRWLKVGS